MRKVEITEAVLRDGQRVYTEGDVVSVDDNKAQQWIHWGWARDPDTGEQGERKPGAQRVKPESVRQTTK